eukprot:3886287-Pleurochrysis_carterae.AAC.6
MQHIVRGMCCWTPRQSMRLLVCMVCKEVSSCLLGDTRSKLLAHINQYVISAEHSRTEAGGGESAPDACRVRGEDGFERAVRPLTQRFLRFSLGEFYS